MAREILVVARDHAALRRHMQRFTYRDLAERSGCSVQRVCDIANRPDIRIGMSLAARIEAALELNRGALFQIEVPDPAYLPTKEDA